ncbi:MAG: hypothetical protein Q8M15_00500 [Bacteroidota bacterium]|nr:hypothetical protein [Bacteroidota bacterium]
MKQITDILKETIVLTQYNQAQELERLKEQFHLAVESLKPVNLLKSAFQKVVASPEIKNNLVNDAIGLTTGYLSKKVLVGATHNPIKKLFGVLLQFTIAHVVAKHSDTIKSAGAMLLQRFMKPKKVS